MDLKVRKNKFFVKLIFIGIVYPNTWPAIGTSEAQYIEIVLRTNESYQFQVPKGSYYSPKQLEAILERGIIKQIEDEFEKKKLFSFESKPKVKRSIPIENSNVKKQKIDYESVETDHIIVDNPRVPERLDDIIMGTIIPREYGRIKGVEIGGNTLNEYRAKSSTDKPSTPKIPENPKEFPKDAKKVLEEKEKSVPVIVINDDDDDELISDEEEDYTAQKASRGDVFKNYPDLLKRFNAKPKSMKNLIQLIKEKEELDKERVHNNTIQESLQARKKKLMKIAESAAPVGSPAYWKLIENVNDEEKFVEVLKSLPQIKIDEYNKKLHAELETRLLLAKSVKFEYQEDIGRFTLKFNDPRIKYIRLSEQLSYVLGFEVGALLYDGTIAKYACDLRGGILFL